MVSKPSRAIVTKEDEESLLRIKLVFLYGDNGLNKLLP